MFGKIIDTILGIREPAVKPPKVQEPDQGSLPPIEVKTDVIVKPAVEAAAGTPEEVFGKSKLFDLMCFSLKDQGFSSRVPGEKKVPKFEKAFTDHWGKLSPEKRALVVSFIGKEGFDDFALVWEKLHCVLTKKL